MNKQRIVYADVIKVFLTCLVVAHHAGQAYGPTGGMWLVSDTKRAVWLGHFFFINASFMMGLYFFISGYFMYFSLQRKTNMQFVRDRLVRLGIPLLFFTFLVFLPLNYLIAGQPGNIWVFFADTYWNKPPAATGHLWFVASLLLYSVIYLLFFQTATLPAMPLVLKPFHIYYIFVYIVLLTFVAALVRLWYPIDVWRTWLIPVEVAHIPQYLSLFLIGILFNRYQWMDVFKLSAGFLWLGVAIAAYTINGLLPPMVKNHWLTTSFIEVLLCVGISMALLILFRHYGNRTNKLVRLMSENAYGIYLFHLLIVIALQQQLLGWHAAAEVKLAVVTFLGILLSLGLSSLVRRIKFIKQVI